MLSVTRLRCEYLSNPVGIDTLAPRMSWELEDGCSTRRGARQTAYRIVVRRDGAGTAWDSGRVRSSQTAQIACGGKRLSPLGTYFWRVRAWDEKGKASDWSPEARWTMGPAESGLRGLSSFRWIGPRLAESWSEREAQPSPYLRREFSLAGPVRRATLFASALGIYEARINGSRVGDALLCPEWTDYRVKVQYQGYDVSDMVREGKNAIGAVLGPGWYAGHLGAAGTVLGYARGVYGRLLGFTALLLVQPLAGDEVVIVTDASWKCTTDGPIRASDIFGGETYDARREMPGWDAAGYDDSAWGPVSVFQGPRLVAQPNEAIRITQDLAPVSTAEPSPGTFILDLGQNMVGWVRMTLHGRPGDDVRIRHGEMLNPDGTLYRDNLRLDPARPLRGAPQEDHYVCRGTGPEVFEPHFTYHGFRYVEVTGVERAPAPGALVGRVLHSDAPDAGTFECSSPVLNKIMAAIQWTQRGNMHGIPTDCPQRDERLGWAGDIQVFCRTAMFNRDMAAFLSKWLRDMRDAQSPDGRFPDFAPHPYGSHIRYSGNPGWADAAVIIPWLLYTTYGDLRALEEAFEPARRWVDFSARENPDLVWRDRGRLIPFFYGDWLNADTFLGIHDLPRTGGEVPKEIYATAFFAHSAELVARMAAVLGRTREAGVYSALARRIRAAFGKAFVSTHGRIKGGTQAGYALALSFDLLPKPLRRKAAARMAAALKPYGGGLSTGIQSTVRLMRELVRWGYPEEAYRLLNRQEMPSWRYMVEHGGTSIWERWDGWVGGRGFQNPDMNSFNHCAIGSVGEWMWQVIGGITLDEDPPGAAAVTISPIPGAGLTWARAMHRTIRGPVSVEWKTGKGVFSLDVSIPPNMTATIVIPGAAVSEVTESETPLALAPGVRVRGRRSGGCAVEVQPGTYRFEARSRESGLS